MKKLVIVLSAVLLVCSLSLSTFAANFTPSAEQKPAPTIVEVKDSNGNPVSAVIEGKDGNETVITSNTDLRLAVTSVSEKDNAVVDGITDLLKNAEDQIKKAENIGALTDDMVKALNELKASTSDPVIKELEITDLVICDLFDVSLVRDGSKLEKLAEGETITFAIKTNFCKDDVFFVLHNVSGENWEVVKEVSLDENGVLTITLDSLSPLAIVIDSMSEKPVDPQGPTSPQTGDFTWIVISVCVIAAIACVAVFVSRRKTHA